jgi:hypothetical protein
MDKNYQITIEKHTYHYNDGWFTRLVHSHSNYRWGLRYDYGAERPYVDSGYARTAKQAEKQALKSIVHVTQARINREEAIVLRGSI